VDGDRKVKSQLSQCWVLPKSSPSESVMFQTKAFVQQCNGVKSSDGLKYEWSWFENNIPRDMKSMSQIRQSLGLVASSSSSSIHRVQLSVSASTSSGVNSKSKYEVSDCDLFDSCLTSNVVSQ